MGYIFTLFTWDEEYSLHFEGAPGVESNFALSDQHENSEEEHEKDDKDNFEESLQHVPAFVFVLSQSKPFSFYGTPWVRLITDRLFKPPKS